MDLDDLDEPSKAPSRTSRFVPNTSKSKAKPKPEAAPKPEPQQPPTDSEPQPPVSKTEVAEPDARIREKKEEGDELEVKPKLEPSLFYEVTKIDVETKSKVEEETMAMVNDDLVDDDPMEEDASEDMVVREIDVLFNPSTDNNPKFYVLQYPLRPRWRPYEIGERCDEVRVKPSSGEVEVDLNVDVESNNYDSRAEDRLLMKKQTLTSSWQPPLATTYAVGLLTGNQLHLNPIHAVVQLRPSFEHLNSDGSKRKNNVGADSDVKLEEPKIAAKKQKKQTLPSTELKNGDEECWFPLKFYGLESDLSTRYQRRMAAQKVSPIQISTSPVDYMDSMCPGASTSSNKPKGPSKRHLLSLSLEERIKKLLLEGHVQRFNVLKHYAPDYEVEEFLEALQLYAQLVQGLWVPKSSFLELKDGKKRVARDFVLHLFSKNPMVSPLQNVPNSLRDAVKDYLNKFGVERPIFKDWKFKEKTDLSFLNNYPDIVQKQEKIWRSTKERLNITFSGSVKSGSQANAATREPNIVPKLEKQVSHDKVTTKSSNVSLNRKSTMSDETREALPKALQKLFQNHKVCSFQLICQGLRDLAVSQSTLPKADAKMAVAAAYGVDAPPDELKSIISQVATEIHGLYVLMSSPEHPEYDPLRKVVIQLLRGRGPKAVLKKADVFEASKRELGRVINNNEYSKVMNEICVSSGSSWALKSGDGNSR